MILHHSPVTLRNVGLGERLNRARSPLRLCLKQECSSNLNIRPGFGLCLTQQQPFQNILSRILHQPELAHVFSYHRSDTENCPDDASRPQFGFLFLPPSFSYSTLNAWFSGSERRWLEDQSSSSVHLNKKKTRVIQPWAGLRGKDGAYVTGVAMSNHQGLSAFNLLSSLSCLCKFYFCFKIKAPCLICASHDLFK